MSQPKLKDNQPPISFSSPASASPDLIDLALNHIDCKTSDTGTAASASWLSSGLADALYTLKQAREKGSAVGDNPDVSNAYLKTQDYVRAVVIRLRPGWNHDTIADWSSEIMAKIWKESAKRVPEPFDRGDRGAANWCHTVAARYLLKQMLKEAARPKISGFEGSAIFEDSAIVDKKTGQPLDRLISSDLLEVIDKIYERAEENSSLQIAIRHEIRGVSYDALEAQTGKRRGTLQTNVSRGLVTLREELIQMYPELPLELLTPLKNTKLVPATSDK